MEIDFRDTLYTIDKSGSRKWVYPHRLSGKFLTRRRIVAYVLILLYLLMPWITIHGKQGILIDMVHSRLTFLGMEFWATDTIFLFLTLGILGMSLFFFTATFGRVWCGWACPETVFLEFLFRPIERLIEGSDIERRKLDAAAWGFKKIFKKILKHGFCAVASWMIASSALAYFIGREPLLQMMQGSPLSNPTPFYLTIGLMALMAFQFGWFREQFCTVLCPYARFQSVLMDQHSLLVGYDKRRGEPRGKVRQKDGASGDCIDCKMCLRVCPTGIDIRNGTQLECVACTACIDACDSIMNKIGAPPGLIRYDTEAGFNGGKSKFVRPRLFVYSAILFLLGSLLFYKLETRKSLDLEIVRVARVEAYTRNGDLITNQFSLRALNKGPDSIHITLKAVENSSVTFASPIEGLEMKYDVAQKVPLFITAPVSQFSNGRLSLRIEVMTSRGESEIRKLNLIGPEK